MPDELSTRQAKRIVKKFCEPPYDLEEARLKEAAWKVLQECKCGSFEWENEEEEEKASKNEIPKENQGIFKSVKKYAAETAQNVQSLGAAGAVAFSSAAYFQTVEAYETTREIGIVIQQVEADYNQSLSSYIMSVVKGEESESEQESVKDTESKSEESQSESKQTTEESAEEAESNNSETQQKDTNENEQREESKNEEGGIETDRSETKSDLQTNPVQSEANDSGDLEIFDSIKPHSMVGDDAFEPVITPHDATVASPAGPQK